MQHILNMFIRLSIIRIWDPLIFSFMEKSIPICGVFTGLYDNNNLSRFSISYFFSVYYVFDYVFMIIQKIFSSTYKSYYYIIIMRKQSKYPAVPLWLLFNGHKLSHIIVNLPRVDKVNANILLLRFKVFLKLTLRILLPLLLKASSTIPTAQYGHLFCTTVSWHHL